MNQTLSYMLAASKEKCKRLTESRDFHLLKFNELHSEVKNVVRKTFHKTQEEVIQLYPGLDISRMSILPKAACAARPLAIRPSPEVVVCL